MLSSRFNERSHPQRLSHLSKDDTLTNGSYETFNKGGPTRRGVDLRHERKRHGVIEAEANLVPVGGSATHHFQLDQ